MDNSTDRHFLHTVTGVVSCPAPASWQSVRTCGQNMIGQSTTATRRLCKFWPQIFKATFSSNNKEKYNCLILFYGTTPVVEKMFVTFWGVIASQLRWKATHLCFDIWYSLETISCSKMNCIIIITFNWCGCLHLFEKLFWKSSPISNLKQT